MDGIRVRNRSEGISILVILRVQVLHDMIREFARDSVAPTPACNFVRNVAAEIWEDCPWSEYWEDDPEDSDDDRHGEWYLRRHLQHKFKIWYHGHGLVRVHHKTIADSGGHCPEVKLLVLRHLTRDERETRDPVDRLKAWRKRVRGRTWTAACKDDWHTWPLSKITANRDLYDLLADETVYKEKGEKIDHIIDLSTLTLLLR
jgi:hypothetical protein